MMDSKPFTDSLKRISEQAKDWGYMARPMAVSEASQSTPRLDDIHGLIREKIAETQPEDNLEEEIMQSMTPSSGNWAKWVCVLSIITLVFSVAQAVLLQRQAVSLHEAQMEQMEMTFDKLNASVAVLKDEIKELKKKNAPPPPPLAKAPAQPAMPKVNLPAPGQKSAAAPNGQAPGKRVAASSGDLK